MKYILDLLNNFGLHVNINENTNPVVLIALSFLILNIVVIFSIVNISIYVVSLYLINTSKYIEQISVKYPYVYKIIKFYNNTRISFIITEFVFLFVSIGYMIKLCVKLIYYLS